MRPRSLLHLYLVRLRGRIGHETLALIGIAAGVSLLFVAAVANRSLTDSITRLNHGIVGDADYELAARTPEGFSEQTLEKVRDAAGVDAAAGMLDVQANALGHGQSRSVLLVGGQPAFASLGGTLVRAFATPALARARAIGMPADLARALGLSFGSTVELQIHGMRRSAPLGAVLDHSQVGRLSRSPVVIAPLRYVQRLARMPGRLTRIYVHARPGHERSALRALTAIASDHMNVREAEAEVRTFQELSRAQHDSTALFAAFSAGVGFLFAFTAVLLTLPQRRRIILDLRGEGYGRLAEVQVLAMDGLLLGLAACAVGIAVGEVLSRAAFGGAPAYLTYSFPVAVDRVVTMRTIATAAAAGLAAAVFAALVPAMRLRAPRSLLLRTAFAAGGIGIFLAVFVEAPGLAVLGIAGLTAGALIARPGLTWATQRLLAVLMRGSTGTAPFIAQVHLRSHEHQVRAAAVAATATIAVLGCVAIQGSSADLRRGLNAAARDLDTTAAVWVTAAGQSNAFATTPIPSNVVRTVAAVPGVRAIVPYRGGFLDWNDRRVWVLAPSPAARRLVPRSQLHRPSWATAEARLRAGGWAVLSRQLADEHRLTVGRSFVLPGVVPTRLRVAALSSNLGWPSGALMLNADDYARAWASREATALQVVPAHATAPSVIAGAIRRALGPDSALTVETAAARVRRHYASTRQALSRLAEIGAILLSSAVMAIGVAMGAVLLQRKPRIERLKLDGIGSWEIHRALLIEAAVLVGTAALAGAAMGLLGQLLLDRALETITGFPVERTVGWPGALATGALLTAAALAVVAIPGAAAARAEPEPRR